MAISKIAILTETSSDLTSRQKKHSHLFQIPLYIVFGNESYKETEEMSHERYYQAIQDMDTLPTTSQPTPGDFMEKYQEILDAGFDEVVVITMSSKLSGTGQSAKLAAEDFPSVHVFNTRMATFAEGLMVEEACLLAEAGGSSQDILERLSWLDRQAKVVGMLVNLDNIVKGGRLPKIAGQIQSFFDLKFLISLSDGKVSFLRQTRTESRGFQTFEKELEKAVKASQHPLKVTVGHVNDEAKARSLLDQLKARFPDIDYQLTSVGPVIGTHVGTGAVGVAWIPNDQ